ncbi:pirin family protein [Neptunicella sp. SCSIO 80796]|uniref:pirin family protein n=1 Tax=Neptunicella plasticusilytica TaxID=3117012 RepID=UPI003A4E1EE7
MQYVRKATERGKVDLGWLQSQHSFSFGHYYDPKHMGVSALRVINQDQVQPGKGFETHGHKDMEIISYVIEGALEHTDSTGNRYIVPAGDIQLMSAGSGIMHSEFNASKVDPVRFLQIWIQPNVRGISPGYQQQKISQQGQLTPLITPDGRDGTLSIHQDAVVSRLILAEGDTVSLATAQRQGYLHLVAGKLSEAQHSFAAGDAFALGPNEEVTLQADEAIEALWFDLP